jgi:hypothetical protein
MRNQDRDSIVRLVAHHHPVVNFPLGQIDTNEELHDIQVHLYLC